MTALGPNGWKALGVLALVLAGMIFNGLTGTTIGCLAVIPLGSLLGRLAGEADAREERA